MNKESRLKNSKKNIINGIIFFLLTTLLTFFVRLLFVKFLNIKYLGINGLYSNILQILSLSEFGLGSIALSILYKPIIKNDISKINSLVKYFSKAYKYVSVAILLIGICLCPFLKYIVNSNLNDFDLIAFYILFLLDTSISYIGVSNQILINADQKIYIIKNINLLSIILRDIFQIIILFIFKNYYLYLVIQILSTILINILSYYKARSLYPFLKDKNKKELDKRTKKDIISKMKGIFIYKLSVVIINSTDNIFISILLGLTVVGYYSNYALIITAISSFINILISAIFSSIGNLTAGNDVDKKTYIFYKFVFSMQWLISIISICLFILFNDFITLWIGKKYLISNFAVLAIVIDFYFKNIINPVWIYRETMGLFNEVKKVVVARSILNIIFTWLLGIIMGLPGIFVATIISRILTTVWKEPLIILRDHFNKPVKKYFLLQLFYIIIFSITFIISFLIFNNFKANNLIEWVIKAISIFAFTNIIYIIVFHRTENYIYFKNLFKKILTKK